jgi:hypothetical protein
MAEVYDKELALGDSDPGDAVPQRMTRGRCFRDQRK